MVYKLNDFLLYNFLKCKSNNITQAQLSSIYVCKRNFKVSTPDLLF